MWLLAGPKMLRLTTFFLAVADPPEGFSPLNTLVISPLGAMRRGK